MLNTAEKALNKCMHFYFIAINCSERSFLYITSMQHNHCMWYCNDI